MHYLNIRPAIAMIELIFSIVIMGIALLSAPLLISTAAKSTSVALQQEGINEAASRINMVLTYDWDNNNIAVPCGGSPSILLTDSATPELRPTGVVAPRKRIGVPISSPFHTYNCGGMEYRATAIGREGTGIDDIDDFNAVNLTDVPLGTGGQDYIEQTTVNIATSITYTSDAASYNQSQFSYNFTPGGSVAGTSNIKAIQVTLTSSHTAEELEKTIILNAFSCNIGSYGNYNNRTF